MPASSDNGNFNENSFISSYSSLNQHNANKQLPDSYVFHKPTFIYGEHKWTFGKHFFQTDASLIEKDVGKLPARQEGKGTVEYQCYLTIGLICTPIQQEEVKEDRPLQKGVTQQKKNEDERVIVGCKVCMKLDSVAQVQVFVNIEKHLMLCIANGKVKEKFDLSQYESFLPVVKYDGDAHKQYKVISALQFDMQIPHSVEQAVSEQSLADTFQGPKQSGN